MPTIDAAPLRRRIVYPAIEMVFWKGVSEVEWLGQGEGITESSNPLII